MSVDLDLGTGRGKGLVNSESNPHLLCGTLTSCTVTLGCSMFML